MVLRFDMGIAFIVLAIWLFVMPSVWNTIEEEIKTELSETPKDIHIAAESGDLDTVRLMLEQGVDVNLRDRNGNTPLFLASRWGHFQVAQFLVQCGADVNIKCAKGSTPLWAAANKKAIEIIHLLLENGAEMNLAAASVLDDMSFFKNYFETGGDVNKKIGKNGLSLIHVVASKGAKREIIELLIANGANVNERNEKGWTPLHLAATCRNPQTAEVLIAHGADLHAKTIYGQTPLHCASYSDCPEVAELLIACGAEIEESSNGETPLYTAIENGYPEVVRVLVANGAEVNVSDSWGNTLLHKVIAKEYFDIRPSFLSPKLKILNPNFLEIAKILIENGADVNVRRGFWRLTTVDYAHSPEMIALLKSYGAKSKMY